MTEDGMVHGCINTLAYLQEIYIQEPHVIIQVLWKLRSFLHLFVWM
jgi:hypothetical protein